MNRRKNASKKKKKGRKKKKKKDSEPSIHCSNEKKEKSSQYLEEGEILGEFLDVRGSDFDDVSFTVESVRRKDKSRKKKNGGKLHGC